jgi:hypothetical protein
MGCIDNRQVAFVSDLDIEIEIEIDIDLDIDIVYLVFTLPG